MILLDTITSNINRKCIYGHKGETVRLVADHGNVLIVEGSSGRFPVHRSKLMAQEAEVKKEIIKPIVLTLF